MASTARLNRGRELKERCPCLGRSRPFIEIFIARSHFKSFFLYPPIQAHSLPTSTMGYAVEEVDIPFANLQAKNPDIKRFSASTIIFCRDTHNATEPYVFLCKRAHWDHSLGKANSWAGSWETPGGSHDHGERILDTAIRETREEANLHVSHVSRHVYFDDWTHKGVPMARYTFHTEATSGFPA